MKAKNKLFKNFKDGTTEKINLIKKMERIQTSSEVIDFLVKYYLKKNKKKLEKKLNDILKEVA